MKKLGSCLMSIVLLSVLVGCAAPRQHITPSGKPEVTINGLVADRARSKIMNLMINRGYNMKSATDTLLVFEKPIDNVLMGALLGSRYDSTPAARVTITIMELENSTRIVSSFGAITNPGSAFERITPMNNHYETFKYQDYLNNIKFTLEKDTQPKLEKNMEKCGRFC